VCNLKSLKMKKKFVYLSAFLLAASLNVSAHPEAGGLWARKAKQAPGRAGRAR
jgi:hypothetical protein